MIRHDFKIICHNSWKFSLKGGSDDSKYSNFWFYCVIHTYVNHSHHRCHDLLVFCHDFIEICHGLLKSCYHHCQEAFWFSGKTCFLRHMCCSEGLILSVSRFWKSCDGAKSWWSPLANFWLDNSIVFSAPGSNSICAWTGASKQHLGN